MKSEANIDELPAPGALYQKVKQFVIGKIAAGELRPNDQIPSEYELVEELGVSRATANRALRELTAEGIARRIQGVGTFVAPAKPQSDLTGFYEIAAQIKERGGKHSIKLIELSSIRSSEEIAHQFEQPARSILFHSIVLHSENSVPIQIEERFVNPTLAPHYITQNFKKATTAEYLLKEIPVTSVENVIHAVKPNESDQRLLKISKDEPCILLFRRIWSGSTIAAFTRLVYPGSSYCFISKHPLQGRAKN